MTGAITVGGKSLSVYSNLTLNGVAAQTLEVGKNLTSEINVYGSGLNIRTDQNDESMMPSKHLILCLTLLLLPSVFATSAFAQHQGLFLGVILYYF